jgi:hypothetical protein
VSEVLGDILPLAIAVTISPVPIVAAILLLFTERRIPNGGAYVIGFTAGVAAVLGVLVTIAGTQDLSGDGAESTATAVLQLVLGALLLLAAVRQFRARPAPGAAQPMPRWMEGISSFGAGKSLLVGLVVGAANPKNVAMALGASVAIAGAGLPASEDVVVVVVYTVVAVLGVAAPLGITFVMGQRAQGILDGWKAWLAHNNSAVMCVLFLVFGVILIGKGLQGI